MTRNTRWTRQAALRPARRRHFDSMRWIGILGFRGLPWMDRGPAVQGPAGPRRSGTENNLTVTPHSTIKRRIKILFGCWDLRSKHDKGLPAHHEFHQLYGADAFAGRTHGRPRHTTRSSPPMQPQKRGNWLHEHASYNLGSLEYAGNRRSGLRAIRPLPRRRWCAQQAHHRRRHGYRHV